LSAQHGDPGSIARQPIRPFEVFFREFLLAVLNVNLRTLDIEIRRLRNGEGGCEVLQRPGEALIAPEKPPVFQICRLGCSLMASP
jgi:hypothetical protein